MGRLSRAYDSVEHYLCEVRSQGLVEDWSEYWDQAYRYDVHDIDGRTVPRSSVDAIKEDRAYTATQDHYTRWSSLTMPTLLLRATRELDTGAGFVVPTDDRDRFQQDVPHAEVVEIDANHLTINTHPDTVNVVRRFLASATAP